MSEQSMIERVARTLAAQDNAVHDEVWLSLSDEKRWETYARAAIEAMRDSTDEMRDAACDVGPDTNMGGFSYFDADTIWYAMIDAALSPNTTEKKG